MIDAVFYRKLSLKLLAVVSRESLLAKRWAVHVSFDFTVVVDRFLDRSSR